MGKIVTVRGVGTVPNVEKVLLFDGSFNTAYKILSFQIAPTTPGDSNEGWATLNTIEVTHTAVWDWTKNTQVAWASWNTPTQSRFGQYSNVDEEAIIVEDLFLDFSGSTGNTWNWELVLEQVSIKDWEAALAMVNARAQGSD